MALSADFDPKRQSSDLYSAHVKASTTIYAGALVIRENATGLVEPGANTASLKVFAGIAAEKVTGNSAGTSDIDLYKTGIFEIPLVSASITSIGLTTFVKDDATATFFAGSGTGTIACGKMVDYVSSSVVKICIDGYAEGHPNALGDA